MDLRLSTDKMIAGQRCALLGGRALAQLRALVMECARMLSPYFGGAGRGTPKDYIAKIPSSPLGGNRGPDEP